MPEQQRPVCVPNGRIDSPGSAVGPAACPRLDRLAAAPENGPRAVFFSGGSALREFSRELVHYSHNSTHMITSFDSGGSSAALRQAFDMPAVGDLRNRLMALADTSAPASQSIQHFMGCRLPATGPDAEGQVLVRILSAMASGEHERVAGIPEYEREIIGAQLSRFLAEKPGSFDLRGASVGNLVIAGAYLGNGRRLEPALTLFAELVATRGRVRAVCNDSAHLGARLADGTVLIGQHRMTGKETAPLGTSIDEVFLTAGEQSPDPIHVTLPPEYRDPIRESQLICYAPGSFYSSLIATLLPQGVGAAIADAAGPKVYLPSLGEDPEQFAMGFEGVLRVLLAHLRRDSGDIPARRVLSHVLVDTRHGHYGVDIDEAALSDLGIEFLDKPLISEASAPYYDNRRVLEALFSLI